jgi:hypothetical protein
MSQELIINQHSNADISFLSRLYVWSVIMHPLLFFYVAHEEIFGIGGNIAKILELIVSISVLIAFIFNKNYKLRLPPNIFNIYWLFIFYTIIVGLFGYFFGYYQIDYDISHLDQGILSSPSIRPILEYIVSIFYFFYFVVLAFHFLSNHRIIEYFFKCFFFAFYINLMLGLIDVISTVYFDIDLITVSLIRDSSTNFRFHGLAGEPRDAFVFLIYGISMFYLYDAFKMQKTRKSIVILFSTAAVFLTASASGLIGLVFTALIFIAYAIVFYKPRDLLIPIILIFLFGLIILINFSVFSRFEKYLNALPFLFSMLNSNEINSSSIFVGQMPNIWPIYSRFIELSQFNLITSFFGTGTGSASVLNVNMIEGGDMVLTPHSQAIRLFYSAGIVGTLIYLLAFIIPVHKISLIYNKKILIFFVIFLLGITLGHRSVVLFIFLGVYSAVFSQLSKNK